MAVLQDPILADLALPTLECDRIDCDYLKCNACPPIRLCSRHLVSSLVSLAPHLCEDASGARVAAKRGSVPLLGWSAPLCLPTNQALRGMQQHLIAYSQALGRSERRRCLALRTNTLGAPRLGAFSFASLPTNQALAASRAGVRCE